MCVSRGWSLNPFGAGGVEELWGEVEVLGFGEIEWGGGEGGKMLLCVFLLSVFFAFAKNPP